MTYSGFDSPAAGVSSSFLSANEEGTNSMVGENTASNS